MQAVIDVIFRIITAFHYSYITYAINNFITWFQYISCCNINKHCIIEIKDLHILASISPQYRKCKNTKNATEFRIMLFLHFYAFIMFILLYLWKIHIEWQMWFSLYDGCWKETYNIVTNYHVLDSRFHQLLICIKLLL